MSATCTAQITVGGAPRAMFGGSDIGIGPQAVLYLVEGSRAAWILEEVVHNGGLEQGLPEPITWVAPRPERILACGLLMISALVVEEPETREGLARAGAKIGDAEVPHLDLGSLPGEGIEDLTSAAVEHLPSGLKVVVTPYAESSIFGQLHELERGDFEVEVCLPTWRRFADFEGTIHTVGELPPDDPDAHRFTEVRL